MKLIITGAGGLLGAPVAKLARQQGHEIVGILRRPDSRIEELVDEMVIADLSAGAPPAIDWKRHAGAAVIHLAGETRVHEARDFHAANCLTTVAACEMARHTGGRLVVASSSAVYSGPMTQYPVRHLHESEETNPVTAYGRSKCDAENEVQACARDAIILRLFSVLSPRLAEVPPRGHLVQGILRALVTGVPMTIQTDPAGRTPVRDYLGEGDAARGFLEAASVPKARAVEVINLCTGVATSARAMIAFAAEAAGREVPVRFECQPRTSNPVMVGDTGRRRTVFGPVAPSRVREFWREYFAASTEGHAVPLPHLLPKG
jgi:nucleoside-diphosphate-sugar epimerase